MRNWAFSFRKGDALQTLANVSAIALDKTGTITKGHPELTDFLTAPGFDRNEVLAFAAAVEARSEHPIAMAIVAAGQECRWGREGGQPGCLRPKPSDIAEKLRLGGHFYRSSLRVKSRAGTSEPARAITARAEDFAARPGLGAEAEVEGHHVAVGADRFMRALRIDVTDFAEAAARFGEAGKSPLYAAIDGKLWRVCL